MALLDNFQRAFAGSYEAQGQRMLEARMGRPLTAAEVQRLARVASDFRTDTEAVIYNPVKETRTSTTLSSLAGWIETKAPILTGHGTLFRTHEEFGESVILDFTRKLLGERKVIKSEMIAMLHAGADPTDAKVRALDQGQKVYKLLANSFFGALGERGFHFYDPALGPAITYTGQQIIASMLFGFETFLTGNLWIKDEDELARHVAECVIAGAGESPATVWGDPGYRATPEEVGLRLLKQCAPGWDSAGACAAVADALRAHPESERACWALILRGDPHAFLGFPKCQDLLAVAAAGSIAEADPGKMAAPVEKGGHPEGKAALEHVWEGLRQWVATPYLIPAQTARVVEMKRKAVILSDTDSTFLTLRSWMDYAATLFDMSEATDEERLTVLNMMVYLIRLFSDYQMGMLTKNMGVPAGIRGMINFKSEFVMSRMVLTGGKKHYLAWITFQEGAKLANGGKADFKGLAMKKTNIGKVTGDHLQSLCKDYVLRGDIRREGMIRELAEFEGRIRDAVAEGTMSYASPASVGKVEGYDNPWSQQQVRGMEAWNAAYPDARIREGDRLNLYRVTVGTDFMKLARVLFVPGEDGEIDMEKPTEAFPGALGIATRVYDAFFSEDAEPGAAKNGLNWFGIPKDDAASPEWVRELIDVDQVVQASVAPMLPILEALGIKILSVGGSAEYSNLISL